MGWVNENFYFFLFHRPLELWESRFIRSFTPMVLVIFQAFHQVFSLATPDFGYRKAGSHVPGKLKLGPALGAASGQDHGHA